MIFKALGFITRYADKKDEIEKAVKQLARASPVIYITESAAERYLKRSHISNPSLIRRLSRFQTSPVRKDWA